MMDGFSPASLTVAIRGRDETVASYVPRVLVEFRGVSTAGFMTAFHVNFGVPTYIWTAYPREFSERYDQSNMIMVDPTLSWARMKRGWIRWEDLRREESAEIYRLTAEFGLNHGIVVSIMQSPSPHLKMVPRYSVATFARPDRPFTEEEGHWLHDQMQALHFELSPLQPMPQSCRSFLRRLSLATVGHSHSASS